MGYTYWSLRWIKMAVCHTGGYGSPAQTRWLVHHQYLLKTMSITLSTRLFPL